MPEYPGLGLPLRYNEQGEGRGYPIGAHGSCSDSNSELISVRELAMMFIMDNLTDKSEWNKKVLNEEIVENWRKEALEIPDEVFWKLASQGKRQWWADGELTINDDWSMEGVPMSEGILSENAFDCCIKELQSKAAYYEKSALIPTLDAGATVVKSDTLVPPNLHDALRNAFTKLQDDQAGHPDWHPKSGNMVQDLVHPSMYPLVYGHTKVFQEELVGVTGAIEKWAGKGEVILKDDWQWDEQRDRFRYGVGSGDVPPQYWSDTYQWLPANVGFQEDGSVKFTSYINNLHPTRYPDIYRSIEKLIDISIPAWEQCLAMVDNRDNGPGRGCPRIGLIDDPDDETPENWIPSDPEEMADVEIDWEDDRYKGEYDPEDGDEVECKWRMLRKPRIPEPTFEDVDYTPKPEQLLKMKYSKSGLQVIVKMASIELTPEKPEFPVGGWHIEGQMNEHIAATALFYLDSDNITDSNLSFRMQTSAYMEDDISISQDGYHWLQHVYGTGFGGGSSPCLQNYGSVETRQGRLLAFPNVFQHRVSPFKLSDPTKPGHRRFIALWLVDPARRIISTANVPPQQQDWWVESIFGDTVESRAAAMSKLPAELVVLLKEKGMRVDIDATDPGRLPAELLDMVRGYLNEKDGGGLMSLHEAEEHRERLMEVRGQFLRVSEEGWQQHSYSFCEH
ncbi:hypothetical protein P154DRAFT_488386 [Amniculicola lignicola CBS 123094]|uniref:Uncharacterized protein n=1 Tax=Amniculicola lignicola CBS 123094 TaxID=1392246 RepID=A0A6A5WNT9_9PLEO|nr:hypothetical protein P154DRAFT_488386 [Amniculicola lignicola CBS 123094]